MKQRYIIELDGYNIKHETKEEMFEKLKVVIPELAQYEKPDDFPWHGNSSRYEVDLDEVLRVMSDLKFKIVGKVYHSDNKVASEVHQDILQLKDTLQGLGEVIDNFSRERDMLNFNLGKNPVVINVQNDKLLAINELVEHKEADYEDIQDDLYAGWMIITTYVERTMSENGDAKPTYVLGRHNSKLKAKELN